MDNLSKEAIEALNKVFSVVRWGNSLKHVKENLYVDERGVTYYLDKMGFHTAIQYSNLETEKKHLQLDKLIRKYDFLIDDDVLSKKKIKKILAVYHLKDSDKIILIKQYLKIK